MYRTAATLILLSLLGAEVPAWTGASLRENFRTPPDSVRPWVYWVWVDGNLSREGITADLEGMRSAGIGGVIIMEVNVGIPQGPVEFMTPVWRQHFAHVVREAERLGLQVSLITGPGWTGSGGPWVKPEQGMQHIVGRTTTLIGPAQFNDTLARPERRPAFFGDGLLPPAQERQKDDYYRDVLVLAYPTPVSGASLSGIDEKAFYIRAPYSSQTSVPSYIPTFSNYPPVAPGETIDPRNVVDITDRYTPGEKLRWNIPAGSWTILRLGATSTGANTRPAPRPGLGLECDKLDTAALNAHFEAFFGTLLREIGPRDPAAAGGWKMLHIDSWEMGAQNWTGAFRKEFTRRRGYDLLPYLPVIIGSVVGSREISERFLWDLRQTVQELILQNHAAHLKTLGRRHGFTLSIEPYDMNPSADMSLGSLADVPMGEFWLYGFNTSYSIIEATSIAHTTGRPVIAAEAFTSGDNEHWDAAPGSMKVLGDWAFAAGVNRFVFHRYQHQPWPALRPGMTMGPYGVHWERTQTWWDMVPAYHTYLSRAQLMLRAGLPVADVCYLVAEGAPHVFQPPRSAVRGNPPDRLGYRFDGCAPEVLIARAAVEGGDLVFPDGMRYRVLVLPERATMTLALLRKIRNLVADGLTVIGPPPLKSPGLSGYPACDSEVSDIARELWGECDGEKVTEHRYGRGRVLWVRTRGDEVRAGRDSAGYGMQQLMRLEASSTAMYAGVFRERMKEDGSGGTEPEQYGNFSVVEGVLRVKGVPVDFASDSVLRFNHRHDGLLDIYFVANPADRVVDAMCTFRVAEKRPELWDPITGTTHPLPEFRESGGRTSLKLRFEPQQSLFIVFAESAAVGREAASNLLSFTGVFDIKGGWDVTFDKAWGGPGIVHFRELADWSGRSEDSIRYFSGIAMYRKTFDLPESVAAQVAGPNPREVWLDLGCVRDMARVRLNGHALGVLWTPPWRVDVSGVLHAKGNVLEIEVANRWRNRLVGDEHLPADAEFGKQGNLIRWPEWLVNGSARPATGRSSFATWRHFTKDTPLLPSGLLGPVRLLVPSPINKVSD